MTDAYKKRDILFRIAPEPSEGGLVTTSYVGPEMIRSARTNQRKQIGGSQTHVRELLRLE